MPCDVSLFLARRLTVTASESDGGNAETEKNRRSVHKDSPGVAAGKIPAASAINGVVLRAPIGARQSTCCL